jgi:hypothetical protein
MSKSSRRQGCQRNVRRFLRRDREGVASTIGTMMALLIFLTLFTMFTNSYLPLWMKDNERQHMTNVMDQMGTLKGKIEIQENLVLISGQTSLPMYQTVQLGASGVPVFVSPTVGILSLMPSGTMNIGMWVTYGTANSSLWTEKVGGMVQLYAPNRYYVPQWIAYENNGILTKQSDGQTMNVAPGISLNGAASTISVGIMTTNFIGANTSVTGYGNGGVAFSTLYVDTDYVALTGGQNVFISITSENAKAFFNYFDQTCDSIDNWTRPYSNAYTRNSGAFYLHLTNDPGTDVQTMILWVKHAVSLNSDVAYVRAALTS